MKKPQKSAVFDVSVVWGTNSVGRLRDKPCYR